MNDSIIFNIQKFSIHDGPGIRTTIFFKGCPLECMWCHNPESQNYKMEILYSGDKCTLCRKCISVCKQNAITLNNNRLVTDMDKCNFCGECNIYCINGCRQIAGKKHTIDGVVSEVLKDKIFYEESNGGVTLSGGEPLAYIDFAERLLERLQGNNIHTAVDTSGATSFDSLEKISKYTDLFLYDLKLMDDEKHKEYIGTSNKIIIENLKKLSKIHDNINIRLPIIEGVNADLGHINGVVNLIDGMGIQYVNLLPYHDISQHKYNKLGRDYNSEIMTVPSDDKMNSFKELFELKGYQVKIGG